MNDLTILTTQLAKVANLNANALSKNGVSYPENYNPQNALKSALFELSKVEDKNGVPLTTTALTNPKTYASVINAINSLLVQGLDASKKQAYFIVYGDEVQLQRSYFGTLAVMNMLPEIKSVKAFEYYEDNKPVFGFDAEKMEVSLKSFNIMHESEQIAGAFVIIKKENGETDIVNMNYTEILNSWSQSQNFGTTVWINDQKQEDEAIENGFKIEKTRNGKKFYKIIEPNAVQQKFSGEMAKRTVINRACKTYINSGNVPQALSEQFNDTENSELKDVSESQTVVAQKIAEPETIAMPEIVEIIEENQDEITQAMLDCDDLDELQHLWLSSAKTAEQFEMVKERSAQIGK